MIMYTFQVRFVTNHISYIWKLVTRLDYQGNAGTFFICVFCPFYALASVGVAYPGCPW